MARIGVFGGPVASVDPPVLPLIYCVEDQAGPCCSVHVFCAPGIHDFLIPCCCLGTSIREEIRQSENLTLTTILRFAIENAFRFEDFTDEELLKILNLKLKSQDLDATDDAKAVAIEVLSRGRNRPNFGNAGEVENQLGLAKGRHQLRQSAKQPSERSSDIVFEPQDFDPDYNRAAHASTNLEKLFEDVVGCEDIIAKLGGYQQIAQSMKKKGLDARGMIPTNFLFKGPPGTFGNYPKLSGPNSILQARERLPQPERWAKYTTI